MKAICLYVVMFVILPILYHQVNLGHVFFSACTRYLWDLVLEVGDDISGQLLETDKRTNNCQARAG
jgi:hypothetical protein